MNPLFFLLLQLGACLFSSVEGAVSGSESSKTSDGQMASQVRRRTITTNGRDVENRMKNVDLTEPNENLRVQLNKIMQTPTQTCCTHDDDDDDDDDSSNETITCPICLGPLSSFDLLYPIPCLEKCHFSVCTQCLSNMRTSAQQETWVEASDGNVFRVTMKCPNCRTTYPKQVVDHVLSLRQQQQQQQQDHHSSQSSSQPPPNNKYNVQEVDDAFNNTANKQDNNPQIIDTALLSGLEVAMTFEEQTYITSLFTSGDYNHVAQAAMALNQIAILSRTPNPPTSVTSSIITKKETVSYTPPIIAHSTGYSNYNRISKQTYSSTRQQLIFKQDEYKRLHPLPVRWPRAFTLQPNLTSTISFIDDETTLYSCYHSEQTENTQTLSLIPLIQDAYCRLHIHGTRIVRQSMQHAEGVKYLIHSFFGTSYVPTNTTTPTTTTSPQGTNNTFSWFWNPQSLWKAVVQGSSRIQETKNIEPTNSTNDSVSTTPTPIHQDMDPSPMIPWRRIVITSVRGQLVNFGIRPGDVITHVNGLPFGGNSQGLQHILSIQEGNSVHIVVNADKGVAKALWLRAQVT